MRRTHLKEGVRLKEGREEGLHECGEKKEKWGDLDVTLGRRFLMRL